ncbi:hypothetical protein [Sulfitobacter pacificus]|uniref:hypothetical protein n=1 Tax=Sulfitobacter pacificus TaxID=1499314 RepID=UPI003103AD73
MKDMTPESDLTIATWPPNRAQLKEHAIRWASIKIKSGAVDLPSSSAEDEVENQIADLARIELSHLAAEYKSSEGEVTALRDRIAISSDAPEQALTKLLNGVSAAHNHHSKVAAELDTVQLAAEVAVSAEASRHELTDPPQEDRSASIIGYALGFMGVEAVVTAMTFLGQTGSSGAAAAVGLALVAATSNIGLGGYLMGSEMLPRAQLKNSERTIAWLYRFLCLVAVVWIFMTNFLLGHFRAVGGDFAAAFAAFNKNPINVGDMTGLLLAGFGIVLAAMWCVKFYGAKDRFLHYGNLGKRVDEAKQAVRDNRGAYTNRVRALADDALTDLDDIAADASTGAGLATDMLSASKTFAHQFEEHQKSLAASTREVVMFRRSVLREMLSLHGISPQYLKHPVDVDDLTRPMTGFKEIEEKTGQLVTDAKMVVKAARAAGEKVEQIVAQALSMPFGTVIQPAIKIGVQDVK